MTATLDASLSEPGPTETVLRSAMTVGRWSTIQTVSIVIPALDEEENIPQVLDIIPYYELARAGCDVEVIVVDNASVDRTGEVAAALGATVILQPARGYGYAYQAGFAAAQGDVIVTGDADCTYPFDALPSLLDHLTAGGYDFLSTNRLGRENRQSMKRSHAVGNWMLTAVSRGFFRTPFCDSQSGMWVFRRSIWDHLDVRSGGMQFSQEIKNEAYLKGFRCDEVPIEYRPRGGTVKLNAFQDGTRNLLQLAGHRARARRHRRAGSEEAVTATVSCTDLPEAG
jgi:glycosyltransferase involved in cell wall biosynthesis